MATDPLDRFDPNPDLPPELGPRRSAARRERGDRRHDHCGAHPEAALTSAQGAVLSKRERCRLEKRFQREMRALLPRLKREQRPGETEKDCAERVWRGEEDSSGLLQALLLIGDYHRALFSGLAEDVPKGRPLRFDRDPAKPSGRPLTHTAERLRAWLNELDAIKWRLEVRRGPAGVRCGKAVTDRDALHFHLLSDDLQTRTRQVKPTREERAAAEARVARRLPSLQGLLSRARKRARAGDL